MTSAEDEMQALLHNTDSDEPVEFYVEGEDSKEALLFGLHKIASNVQSGPDVDDDSDHENKCGICGRAPGWCQVFNSIKWSLFFLGMAAFIQGNKLR